MPDTAPESEKSIDGASLLDQTNHTALQDDPEAQKAVETYINDIFNFDAESTLVVTESPERKIATDNLGSHAYILIERYLFDYYNRKKQIKSWDKEGFAVLPEVELEEGKFFQLTARRDLETGHTHIEFGRTEEGMPANGFTIIRRDSHNSIFLLATDRALDTDKKYLKAVKKANKWLNDYAGALTINTSQLDALPHGRVFPEDMPQKRAERRKRVRGGMFAAAITVGAIVGIGEGGKILLDRHKASNAEFDATHFLPKNAQTIRIGEAGQVAHGVELDQEVIDTADFTNGAPRKRVIENAGSHFIRANEDMEIAAKGHGNSSTGDCEHIKLEGLGPHATIKVVALKKEVAEKLEARLDRTEMLICNTNTDEGASVKLTPRQLFIEIANPEEG